MEILFDLYEANFILKQMLSVGTVLFLLLYGIFIKYVFDFR